MKKRLILATIAAFAVSGAGAQQPSGKVLVAYFSHSGNTREVARQISEATGGDLFEIVPATPYPTEYRAVVPFMTHEGSGMRHSEADIRRLCPRSTVPDGLAVRGSAVRNSKDEVGRWVRIRLKNGF